MFAVYNRPVRNHLPVRPDKSGSKRFGKSIVTYMKPCSEDVFMISDIKFVGLGCYNYVI